MLLLSLVIKSIGLIFLKRYYLFNYIQGKKSENYTSYPSHFDTCKTNFMRTNNSSNNMDYHLDIPNITVMTVIIALLNKKSGFIPRI